MSLKGKFFYILFLTRVENTFEERYFLTISFKLEKIFFSFTGILVTGHGGMNKGSFRMFWDKSIDWK